MEKNGFRAFNWCYGMYHGILVKQWSKRQYTGWFKNKQ